MKFDLFNATDQLHKCKIPSERYNVDGISILIAANSAMLQRCHYDGYLFLRKCTAEAADRTPECQLKRVLIGNTDGPGASPN